MLGVVHTDVGTVPEGDRGLAFGLVPRLLGVDGAHAHKHADVPLEIQDLVVEPLPLLHALLVLCLQYPALLPQLRRGIRYPLDLAAETLAHFSHLLACTALLLPQLLHCLHERRHGCVQLLVKLLSAGQPLAAPLLGIPNFCQVAAQRFELLRHREALLLGSLDGLVLSMVLRRRQLCFLLCLDLLQPLLQLLDALLQLLAAALGLGLLRGGPFLCAAGRLCFGTRRLQILLQFLPLGLGLLELLLQLPD
mmetsp:Transcript_129721/g.361320  ORF Transcript_129721/g.361320 Transcript_129721/m.361320 type:complete len:250 (+) Transcript_129721:1177-1926(+)